MWPQQCWQDAADRSRRSAVRRNVVRSSRTHSCDPAPATAKDASSGQPSLCCDRWRRVGLSYPSGKVVDVWEWNAQTTCVRTKQAMSSSCKAYKTVLEYSTAASSFKRCRRTTFLKLQCRPNDRQPSRPYRGLPCVLSTQRATAGTIRVQRFFAIVGLCAYDSHGTVSRRCCGRRTPPLVGTLLANSRRQARRFTTPHSGIGSGTMTMTASIGMARIRYPIRTRIRSTACISRTKRRSSARRTSADGLAGSAAALEARDLAQGRNVHRAMALRSQLAIWSYPPVDGHKGAPSVASAGTSVDGVDSQARIDRKALSRQTGGSHAVNSGCPGMIFSPLVTGALAPAQDVVSC